MSVAFSLIFGALAAGQADAEQAGLDFFEKKVRPVLSDRCYRCHSAESKAVRGGLYLDSREGIRRGGKMGPAVVPGKPEESLLIKAVRQTDPHLKMPPKGKLEAEEVADLTRWVALGAPDPRGGGAPAAAPRAPSPEPPSLENGRRHWAFQPLAQPEPPAVKDAAWCRTPVDRFILAKLEERGLAPAARLAPAKLVRRAYFDLVGLPPPPEEIDAFAADPSPEAWGRLIARLLASPHHGERWGRHWLDLARFAESHGFEHDYDRPTAYHYRDFVIQALNSDLPYDMFVRWQLAGDEIEPENHLALMATGFLAAGVHSTQITKNQAEKERYDELDDMLATTGSAMLGLTLGCARCHDHKYDPIPQADYYRLVSTFTTTVRSEMDLDTDPAGYRAAKAAFDREHTPYVEAIARLEREELPKRLAEWEKSRVAAGAEPPAPWIELETASFKSEGGAALALREDGSILASGANPDFDTYQVVVRTELTDIRAVRLEALSHSSMPHGGPGRAGNGNFALSSFRMTAAPVERKSAAAAPPAPKDAVLRNARATFEQKGLPVKAAIDGDAKSAWAVDPQFGKDHAAAFELAEPVGFEGCTVLTFTLEFKNNSGHGLGRFRLSAARTPEPDLAGSAIPERAFRALSSPPESRSEADRGSLLRWYRTLDAEWRKLMELAEAHASTAPRPAIVKALVSSEGVPAVRLHTQGPDFYDKTFFLKRGDPNQKGWEATSSFLTVLCRAADVEKAWREDPPAGWRTSYRRRCLANWIVDVERGAGNLLARVIVNRLWQHHFGRGLVATPNDFGTRGAPPTHPELLDWLASELIARGWKLKSMHALLLQSAAWQMGTELDAASPRLDPDNALWRRRPIVRLEAEAIRDAILAVSGTLDTRLYGPGTLDAGHRRRSIYFTVKRSQLVPMLMLFDAPEALQSAGHRPVTTVAPQSLLLMNSPAVREAAGAFARRLRPLETAPVDVVRAGYRLALGRSPTKEELAENACFIEEGAEAYRAGGKPEAAGRDAAELAAADFCQVLLSLNEFIYVE